MKADFKYLPLTGRLPGKSFVEQTEKAINELAEHIQDTQIPVEEWTALINQAVNTANEALQIAQEAQSALAEMRAIYANVQWAENFVVIDGVLHQKLETDSEVENE